MVSANTELTVGLLIATPGGIHYPGQLQQRARALEAVRIVQLPVQPTFLSLLLEAFSCVLRPS
jgi:hypothetical protein